MKLYQALLRCAAGLVLCANIYAQSAAATWQLKIPAAPVAPFVRNISALPDGRWAIYTPSSRLILGADLAIQNANLDGNSAQGCLEKSRLLSNLIDHGSATLDRTDIEDELSFDGFFVNPPNDCTVRRYSESGNLIWRQQLILRDYYCVRMVELNDSQLWVLRERSFERLGVDGSILGKKTLLNDSVSGAQASDIAASPVGGALITLQNPIGSQILRLDARGTTLWQFEDQARRYDRVFATLDGDALAIASSGANGASLLRLDPQGAVVWRRPIGNVGLQVADASMVSDESLRLLVAETPSTNAIYGFDNQGDLRWRAPVVAADIANLQLLTYLDKTLIATANSLAIYDANGAVIFSRAVQIANRALDISADGTQILYAKAMGGVSLLNTSDGTTRENSLRWAEFGQRSLLREIKSDDSVFVASRDLTAALNVVPGQLSSVTDFDIHAFTKAGIPRWQKSIANGMYDWQSGPNTLCLVQPLPPPSNQRDRVLRCFAADTGLLRFEHTFPEPFYDLAAISVLSNRVLTLATGGFDRPAHYQGFDFQGRILFDKAVEVRASRTLNETGLVLVSSDAIQRLDANGLDLGKFPTPTSAGLESSQVLSDGVLKYESNRLEKRDFAGALKWQAALNGVPAPLLYPLNNDVFLHIVEAPDALIVLAAKQHYSSFFDPVFLRPLAFAINKSTGAVLWQKSLEIDARRILQAAPEQVIFAGSNSRNNNFLQFLPLDQRESFQFIAPTTGANLGVQTRSGGRLASYNREGLLGLAQASAEIQVRNLRTEFGGAEIVITKQPLKAQASEAIGRLRAGAWYNPDTPGQGFLIEQIGDVQFLAWFHSAPVFTNTTAGARIETLSPKSLSWLTLQGDAATTEKSVPLKIYSTKNGAFATGLADPPRQVGDARLEFQSCTEATLSYDLEELDACAACTGGQIPSIRRGVIPLRSLLPATGCASPTALPAPISHKTGLFHDPNVAGQGILTVFNQGTLFAGWFSFDPQGGADDSAQQLWFTLQASNITGNPNRISSRIYRTLGARRDQQSSTSSLDIGEAILDFSACDKLRVRYQFNDEEAALAMRGLQGVLNLERIGACRAP